MIAVPPVPAIIVPGIDGSGPGHWQTLLEEGYPAATRFQPSSWASPDLTDWLAALSTAVDRAGAAPVLVAHSLGALLVAHWAAKSPARVAGALLVAIPDPDAPSFPAAAPTFRDVPRTPLPFPSIVVAGGDDPYDPSRAARGYAAAWGSRYLDLAGAGHVNPASGYGSWPLAAELLADLA